MNWQDSVRILEQPTRFLPFLISVILSAEDIRETSGMLSVESDKISLHYVMLSPDKAGKLPSVVVCHPDPRLGGSMESHIVVGIARAWRPRATWC